LTVVGVLLWASWPRSTRLTPGQHEELGRLAGHFEGVASNNIPLATPWEIVWRADFSTNNAGQLLCTCAPVLDQNSLAGKALFVEIVPLQYQDSGKPGYVEVAAGKSVNGNGWRIYAEDSVLKSGREIDSVLMDDDDYGQCLLNRR